MAPPPGPWHSLAVSADPRLSALALGLPLPEARCSLRWRERRDVTWETNSHEDAHRDTDAATSTKALAVPRQEQRASE